MVGEVLERLDGLNVSLESMDELLGPFALAVCRLLKFPDVDVAVVGRSREVAELSEHENVSYLLVNVSDILNLDDQVAWLVDKCTLDVLCDTLATAQVVEADKVVRPGDDDLVLLVDAHAFDPGKRLA